MFGRGICPVGCSHVAVAWPTEHAVGPARRSAKCVGGNPGRQVPVFSDMKLFTAAAFLAVVSPLAACSVSVDEHRDNTADVRILTPVGQVLVRTGGKPETGLAVYPGSTPVRKHREAEAADVTVGNSAFGVKVAAANFESDASPDMILSYYKNALRAHGSVTECRGNIDFRRSGVICRKRLFSRTTQLAVGTEAKHRLVSVKPRGSGSEYSVVYVQTRG